MAARATEKQTGGRDTPGYVPEPRDTSDVMLAEDMRALTEELAKNTHEVWAKQRMAEGWRYGPRRDDARKEHPGLVPYDELPEAEKEYDRNTALETLRLILSLGYHIRKDVRPMSPGRKS